MFLNLKIDEVTIKGRVCTYGRKQRDWLSKEDTSSPTMSNEGIMLSCIIDTMEVQEVATSNIQGAFLKTNYGKGYIHINL